MDESNYYNNNSERYNERTIIRRETSAYKRRNDPNADKIVRTQTIGGSRLDRPINHLPATRREFTFSPVNNSEDYGSVIAVKESFANRRDNEIIPKTIKVVESTHEPLSTTRSKSPVETFDSIDMENSIWDSKQISDEREEDAKKEDVVEANIQETSTRNKKLPEQKLTKAKIRQHHSLNFKSSKSDVIVRDLSSDDDDDDDSALSEIDLNEPFSCNSQDNKDEDEDYEANVESKKNPTAVHPITNAYSDNDAYSKKKKSQNKSTVEENISEILNNPPMYDLLVGNTIEFVLEQPPPDSMVKCFIWRSKKLFQEYTMYIEVFNPFTKKTDAIPILIASKKKATAKLFLRIAALSMRKSLLETYKRFDLGKLKSKSIISFKKHQYVLTGSKQNPLKSLKRSELSGNFPNRGSSQNIHRDLVYSLNPNSFVDIPTKKKKTKEEILRISYDGQLFKTSKPSQLSIVVVGPSEINDFETKAQSNTHNDDLQYPFKLINKTPEYDQTRKQYLLDFKKRVNFASVNNFQIVFEHDVNSIIMQCGKAQKNYYICDYTYPLNAFQAFSIALSKLTSKNI
jgi:hypothetical protein